MSPFSYSSSIDDGRKVVATAGTRERLSDSGVAATQVAITAETDNAGTIVVGGATVVATAATRRGTPLEAGDTISFEGIDLRDIYLDATTSGEGVTYTYTSD